jgi:hypothetical protein
MIAVVGALLEDAVLAFHHRDSSMMTGLADRIGTRASGAVKLAA